MSIWNERLFLHCANIVRMQADAVHYPRSMPYIKLTAEYECGR